MVVDIGTKSEGMLPLAEVLDHEGKPKFKPGDEIDVMREKGHTEEGYINLSHQKAQRIHAWDEIEKAYNEKTPDQSRRHRSHQGRPHRRYSGRARVPARFAGRPAPRPQPRRPEGPGPSKSRIIKLNKKRGNIVVSRKQLLEERADSKSAPRRWSTWKKAPFSPASVKNLTEYGAFVDLGGIDGLLHITDMSWGRLTHPRDLVKVGDQIQVKVLKFDKDKQRVSLGFKQLTPDPWLDAERALSRRRARSAAGSSASPTTARSSSSSRASKAWSTSAR